VTGVGTLAAAHKLVAELNFDYALLDVNLPDGQGTDLLREKALSPGTGVIIMTADGAVSGAVAAMRLGALDYLVKPFDPAELPLVIGRVRRSQEAARRDEHRRANEEREDFFFGAALAGVESQLQKILAADQRIQGPLPPVLILGETGTGKTSVARWLHHHGARASQPLVEINCSALPETLAEAELFGHERGAFTDARAARLGLFEAANGGSLFLDELSSLSPALQAKVLTAIEEGRIRRLGGNKQITVDVRVIAASHRDLKELVAAGQFREDLYHRLDLFRLWLPPLRERGTDILRLAEGLLQGLCQRYRVGPKRVSADGQRRLLGYGWPGNVRELAHELERAVVFAEGNDLHFEHLPGAAHSAAAPGEPGPAGPDWFNERFEFPAEGFALDAAIDRLVRHAMQQAGDNVSAAARLLGVSRDVVRYRLAGKKGSESDQGGEG
jgi:DNA-binding NtrC family response regulator